MRFQQVPSEQPHLVKESVTHVIKTSFIYSDTEASYMKGRGRGRGRGHEPIACDAGVWIGFVLARHSGSSDGELDANDAEGCEKV